MGGHEGPNQLARRPGGTEAEWHKAGCIAPRPHGSKAAVAQGHSESGHEGPDGLARRPGGMKARWCIDWAAVVTSKGAKARMGQGLRNMFRSLKGRKLLLSPLGP